MKSTDSASKITARHLARKAVVYLRQSSIAQVRAHVESTRLQYALKDTAKAYGFAQIDVIDVDLEDRFFKRSSLPHGTPNMAPDAREPVFGGGFGGGWAAEIC